ncbi:MAG: HAD-IA family hydrolase [Desulfatitalea sp.]|nr:HAD-IA family hydrolase [Desulfatitalea sp.]
MSDTNPPIRAVLFDFDGTLTLPGALDFPAIKQDLGCPPHLALLEFIETIHESDRRWAAQERLAFFESQAARHSRPNAGAQELVAWLRTRRVAVAILTRNSRASVLCALENFNPLTADSFDLIVTRDDPVAPKPSGEGVLYAARALSVTPAEIFMVGDFIFDCQAGRAAGARTVLLDPQGDPRLAEARCDYRIRQLCELKALLKA